MVNIPSTATHQNYAEISTLCKETVDSACLTANGSGDSADMNIEAGQREKMLQLRDSLLRVEENRLRGSAGHSIKELEQYLSSVINWVA